MSAEQLTVTITADTGPFERAMRRVWLTLYRRTRWQRQEPDPSPFPAFRFFRWLP